MSDKISVIVPVYNGEEYLTRCLDSLKRQTWSNMEFLLIDDGSKDGSAAICKKYAVEDNRFIYQYKENGGVSSARNFGLKLATGDYIGFCDCDDWVDDDFYEYLYQLLMENKADVSVTSMQWEPSGKPCSACEPDLLTLYSAGDAYNVMFQSSYIFAGNNVAKLFSKKTVQGIAFDEDISMAEDLMFSARAFLQAETVVFQNKNKYHYFAREDSAVHQTFSRKYLSSRMVGIRLLADNPKMQEKQTIITKKYVLSNDFYLLMRLAGVNDLHKNDVTIVRQDIRSFISPEVKSIMSKSSKIALLVVRAFPCLAVPFFKLAYRIKG